jgi:Cu2+-exporting ATPase
MDQHDNHHHSPGTNHGEHPGHIKTAGKPEASSEPAHHEHVHSTQAAPNPVEPSHDNMAPNQSRAIHSQNMPSHVHAELDHNTPGGHSNSHGRGPHAHHDPQIFFRKLLLSALFTIPVLAVSPHFLGLFGIMAPHFSGGSYIAPLFGSLVFFYGGLPFLKGAGQEIKTRQPGMMTLIALAISVSYGYSLLVTFGLTGEEIYWELTTLIVIMLLGHWLEMTAVQNAGSALNEMARLLPDTAVKINGEQLLETPVADLAAGDLLLVRPGARIPADGEVVMGNSLVNESMVTGESVPVPKKPGDGIIAGTINEDGALRIKVLKTGSDTYLAGIMRLVEEAQRSRSRSQILADRAAFWLVIIALGSALVTALAWNLAGAPLNTTMERVVTVMVSACPHALGLAIPLVVAISTTLTARAGLLVRNRLMLEEARNVNYVVFDKTGTLTRGEHKLSRIVPAPGFTEEQVLSLAAAAEFEAEHMLGRGIVNAARERKLNIPQAVSFESMPGRGITAHIDGREVQVGGPNLLNNSAGIKLALELIESARQLDKRGMTTVYLIVDQGMAGLLALADVVKEESYEAITSLKGMGIKVAMLTGDNAAVAAQVSYQLGIDEYFAGILPENKADKIRELQSQGYRVAMVGDGVNDAPSLAQADVGIAIGAGTDVAIESAGIVLVHGDPRDIVRLLQISKASYRKMLQNLAWATGYNAVIIPLAAGVLAPWGFVLPMAAGAVVMSLSTVIVALNAQLLKKTLK